MLFYSNMNVHCKMLYILPLFPPPRGSPSLFLSLPLSPSLSLNSLTHFSLLPLTLTPPHGPPSLSPSLSFSLPLSPSLSLNSLTLLPLTLTPSRSSLSLPLSPSTH